MTVNPSPSGAGGEVGVQGSQRGPGEGADLVVGAEGGADRGGLGRDLVGVDGALGEPGPGPVLAVGHRAPLDVEFSAGLADDLVELEERLLVGAGLAAQEQPFHDRVGDLAGGLVGDGHGDAGELADLAVLADEDFEDLAVDAVVAAVDGDDADVGRALAEAVDAAFALLVPGGVPGEVVVDDGVEVVLEVDALGQAVGGDQDAAGAVFLLGCLGELLDAVEPLGRGERAVDAGDDGLPAELAVQLPGEVLAGGDVAAEDDRVVAVGEELLDGLDEQGELLVLLGALQGGGALGERGQARVAGHGRGGARGRCRAAVVGAG